MDAHVPPPDSPPPGSPPPGSPLSGSPPPPPPIEEPRYTPAAPPPAPPVPPFGEFGGTPPPGAPANVLPWERPRASIGEFFETIKIFFTQPVDGFRRVSMQAPIWRPLVFGILISWIGALFSSAYEFLFRGAIQNLMPNQFEGYDYDPAVALAMTALGGPFFLIIAFLLIAAVLQLVLRLLGDGERGYLGTLRVICYASAPALLGIVPFCGSLAATVWELVLTVIGLGTVHRTGYAKAAVAVGIIIVIACCCCTVPLFMAFRKMGGLPF